MEKEKEEWLKTIGAKEFPEPIEWVYSFPEYEGTFNLSERYVKETPLNELKDQYMRNKAYADELLKLKKDREKMARPRGTDCARVIQVIETSALRGGGTEEDKCRIVIQYWDFEGNLLAENDPDKR